MIFNSWDDLSDTIDLARDEMLVVATESSLGETRGSVEFCVSGDCSWDEARLLASRIMHVYERDDTVRVNFQYRDFAYDVIVKVSLDSRTWSEVEQVRNEMED